MTVRIMIEAHLQEIQNLKEEKYDYWDIQITVIWHFLYYDE